MKLKKLLTLGLALAMVAALPGCTTAPSSSTASQSSAASSEAPQSSMASSEAPASSAPAATPAEITWWAFPTFGVDSGYEQEVIDAFTRFIPK